MKRMIFFLFAFVIGMDTYAQKIELEGTYQGKNLFIQNPSLYPDKGFCTDKVVVNGKEVSFKKQFAFEVFLDSLDLEGGQALKIEIFHKANCKPTLMVDNSTPKKSLYELVFFKADSTGVLSWQVKSEKDRSAFVVEQFKWNQWKKVGLVHSQKDSGITNYSIQTNLHSGRNKFRLKKTDSLGMVHVSKNAEIESGIKPVKCKGGYVHSDLVFDQVTTYEIYDQYGNVVLKGTGKTVDCRKLPRGAYYLNYDDQMSEFIKP